MSGQITITIENTDDFLSSSQLLVEGNLVKAAGEARYQDADLITLTNNAIMHLFTNIIPFLLHRDIVSLRNEAATPQVVDKETETDI